MVCVAAIAPFAFAAEGERHEKRGGNLSDEVRTELRAAFENNDYTAYVALAEENELKRVATEEQFAEKQEKHADRAEARDAVLAGDYDAWRSVVGDEKAVFAAAHDADVDGVGDALGGGGGEDAESLAVLVPGFQDSFGYGFHRRMGGGFRW